MSQKSVKLSQSATKFAPLAIAPARVLRGETCLVNSGAEIARYGARPLVIGGERTLDVVRAYLQPVFARQQLNWTDASYSPDCAEASLVRLKAAVAEHRADFIVGVGGGKALDTAKLLAHQCGLPIITIPTSGLLVPLGRLYQIFILRREHFNTM